jgi:hypothetical protein
VRLTLHYSGPLKANGSPKDKHAIRRVFHEQLAVRWEHPPLKSRDALRRPPSTREGHGENVAGVWTPAPSKHDYNSWRPLKGTPFTFVPLATQQMSMVVALDIVLLRPEPAGGLITQGGDIDNRMKTLFDALTMPRYREGLPKEAQPAADEEPFYVLLEDDNLVTSLRIRTEHLLKPVRKRPAPNAQPGDDNPSNSVDENHVELVIDVHVTATVGTMGNTSLVL